MTTAILRVFAQPDSGRRAIDVRVVRVTRIPGCAAEQDNLGPICACEKCGGVPLYDPDPTDPKTPVELRLSMVFSPDRAAPIFLGPQCADTEIKRYIERGPIA